MSTLRELAKAISVHLNRFESDPKINRYSEAKRAGLKPFYGAGAFKSGRYVGVQYVSYQGETFLTKASRGT